MTMVEAEKGVTVVVEGEMLVRTCGEMPLATTWKVVLEVAKYPESLERVTTKVSVPTLAVGFTWMVRLLSKIQVSSVLEGKVDVVKVKLGSTPFEVWTSNVGEKNLPLVQAKRQFRIHRAVFRSQTLHQGRDFSRRKDG